MSREDAEELAQDVSIVLMTRFADKGEEELMKVAFGILARMKIGKWRKMQRRGEDSAVRVEGLPLPSGEDNPEVKLRKKQFAQRIANAVAEMGEPCATIFRLKVNGYATEQIQKAVGADSPNAVLIQVSRCRKKLAQKVGNIEGWL
jgi:DNA-directed RNA polymerase specialized sigma24 family protein